MRTILPEFIASMEHIKNNFYLSFLAINFLNLRPFNKDIVLRVGMCQNVVSARFLNHLSNDAAQEYGNSIRRHFLNDMVIAYERYSMLMIASHNNGQHRKDPSLINDRRLGAHLFEQLPHVYHQNDIVFLVQLRRLRNSIVHYNGVYSAANELNYTFGKQTYNSKGKEGQDISIEFNTLLWIYDRLIETVKRGNRNYFAHYPVR